MQIEATIKIVRKIVDGYILFGSFALEGNASKWFSINTYTTNTDASTLKETCLRLEKQGLIKTHVWGQIPDLTSTSHEVAYDEERWPIMIPDSLDIVLEVLDGERIKSYLEEIEDAYRRSEAHTYQDPEKKSTNTSDTTPKDNSRLVTKDFNGDFFYDGQRIDMTQEPLYYHVFDILFSYQNQFGFVSYEEVEKYLVERGFAGLTDKEKSRKRIINAVSEQQGLFRVPKIGDKNLINRTPDHKRLITKVRGEGLKLHNPFRI